MSARGSRLNKRVGLFLPDEIVEEVFACLEEEYRPRPGVDPEVTLRKIQPHSMIATSSPFAPPLHEQQRRIFRSISLVCRQWHIIAQEFLYNRLWVNYPKDFETLLECVADPEELDKLFAPGEGAAGMGWSSRDNSPSGRSPGRRSLDDMIPPGLLIRSLSFEKFRTSGLARTVGEGSQHRFVTSTRVLKLLQGTRPKGELEGDSPMDLWHPSGRLKAVAFTEYMDSSLTSEVLLELLLRGGYTTSTLQALDMDNLQEEGSDLALNIIPIRGLDFCGCISRRFVQSLEVLVERFHLNAPLGARRTFFPHLRRLGLFDAGSIRPNLLTSFVTSFPGLTHLDLARTRASPELLAAISKMPIQLRFLSLMRCTSLTGEAIVEFFCGAGASVTSKLVDLCLGSDDSSPTRIEYDQLSTVLQTAPCFHSGLLRVLDLSSCPLDDDLLLSMPITSKLITLGLACCRSLTLEGIASFLRDKAPTVECLDLNKSCAPLHQRPPLGSRRMTGLPHLNSLDLHFQLINQLCPEVDNIEDRPIGLRIIELEERALAGLGAGVGPWKPIYCGRRCFYVETSITGFFEGGERRLVKLALDSEERQGMLKLTEKGTQSDARFGWRPFKMEILFGHGLLGRMDGLYAYHAFQA